MQDLTDKIAFVTGGAGGIGLAIAREIISQGGRVMLADIDEAGLAVAKAELGQASETVVCNVAKSASIEQAAQATIDAFGKVHIVVNNAGVGLGGMPGEVSKEDWQWVVDINLMGVVWGVEAFLPLLKSHGEGGHIINTASMAGHLANERMGPYCATKFAVVGYSESLRQALEPDNIGVSILCPGWVKTAIGTSGQRRPSNQAGNGSTGIAPDADGTEVVDLLANGMPPEVLAQWAIQCVKDNRQYIFSHAMMEPFIDLRYQSVKADYAAAVANETLTRNQTS